MTRLIKNWVEERVDSLPLSPHRYKWDREAREDDFANPESSRARDWKAALPYKEGEVIMVERQGAPVRAKIIHIITDHDRYGDRIAKYRCAIEIARGVFSKTFFDFYPGHVQRGYYLAGLAPDLEGKL